jgi:hypothetical protein
VAWSSGRDYNSWPAPMMDLYLLIVDDCVKHEDLSGASAALIAPKSEAK